MSNLTELLRGAAKITYDNSASGLTATNVKAAIDELDSTLDSAVADIADLVTLSGVAANSTDLGTFTGTTIPDAQTIKQALQALETAHEEVDQNVNDLITLTGVAENATNLGTFTGSTISNNTTIKSALQELETAVEANSASINAFDWKNSVRATTTTNINLASASDPGAQDGVTLSNGDDILLKNQTTASENGIYTAVTATDPTTWIRRSDADSSAEVNAGMAVAVEEGTLYADSIWILTTNDPITLNTTSLAFARFDAGTTTAGDGIDKVGDVISVDVTDIIGNGLSEDGSNNLIVLPNTTETSTVIASAILVDANGVAISVDDSTIEGSGQGAAGAESLRVKDLGITTAKLAATSVTAAKLGADVAGTGLTGGNGSAIAIDFSTTFAEADKAIAAADLASTANGEGASIIGVEDAGGNYTATDVEGVLTEIDGRLTALEGATGTAWTVKTANYTAVDGDRILADTVSVGAFTITLPASPTVGDEIRVRDSERNTETAAITVARNGSNIAGLAENLTIDINGADVTFVYASVSEGWSVSSTS